MVGVTSRNSPISPLSQRPILNPLRIHPPRRRSSPKQRIHLLAVIVHVFQVESVDVAGEVAMDSQRTKRVDEEETNPRIVRRTLIKKSMLKPDIAKTPRGGTRY